TFSLELGRWRGQGDGRRSAAGRGLAEARWARDGGVGAGDPVPVRDLVPDPGAAHRGSRPLADHPGERATRQLAGERGGDAGATPLVGPATGRHLVRITAAGDRCAVAGARRRVDADIGDVAAVGELVPD